MFQDLGRHLLNFQQVILIQIPKSCKFHEFQAGLISLEKLYVPWKWEEEVTIFTLENVGLGKKYLI